MLFGWGSAGNASYAPTPLVAPTPRVPAAIPSLHTAPYEPADPDEQKRQRSVDLLRDRAFHVRESTAEQLAKRLQAELDEVRREQSEKQTEHQHQLEACKIELTEQLET